MIMAVAVAVAAVSQAASIAWGGAISQPDGATELAANTMAYLVYSSSAITGGASFDGTNLKNGSDATIASTVSTHTITATEAAGWEFGETYAKSGSDVNGFYAVLISTKNHYPELTIPIQREWLSSPLSQQSYFVTHIVNQFNVEDVYSHRNCFLRQPYFDRVIDRIVATIVDGDWI